MITFAIACWIPVATVLAMASWRCPRTWEQWKPRVASVLLLFCLGLYAAAPFLRGTYVGTGESYNYSLSLADAVMQERSGGFPAMVGQTEFAFNGRIHPVRTAPWYCCAACLLDVATGRSLNFWQLQDSILTLSILAAAFSAYASLRFLVGATRTVALVGAIVFELSPGVIATAYAMDLYMTVTALPLVPLVFASNVATFGRRSILNYLVLGTSIGFAWLAHPPIALWLSAVTAIIQVTVWVTRKPTWSAVMAVFPGLFACFLLASYSFASTAALRDIGGLSRPEDFSPLFVEIARAFPACLMPVSAEARSLSDFQIGYVGWAMLLVGFGVAVKRRQLTVLTLFSCAALLILLDLPVPSLTKALWLHLPPAFPNLTNIWPMQRLYLVATGLIITGCCALCPDADLRVRALSSGRRSGVLALCAAGLIWEASEARLFVKRGDLLQHGGEESADLHRSENINLTVTSYALLGVPRHFVNGVMDVGREFRILRLSDHSEIANNWSPTGKGRLRARGTLHTYALNLSPSPLAPAIRIEPDRRYLLSFKFRSAPFDGVLVMEGEHFRRTYPLPRAGASRGFGMESGNDPSVAIWTTNPERIEIHLALVSQQKGGVFADFELREIDPGSFPVDIEGLVPLSGRVHAPEGAWLETPRRFIPGYEASVDGLPAKVADSPEGSVMIEVPSGDHEFRLSYTGSRALVAAFWTTFSTASLLGLAGLAWLAVQAARHFPPGRLPVRPGGAAVASSLSAPE